MRVFGNGLFGALTGLTLWVCCPTGGQAGTAAPLPHGLSIASISAMVGVDVNLDDTGGYGLYASLPDIRSALAWLGITQLRSGLPANADSNFQSYQQAAWIESLSQSGDSFALVFPHRDQGIAFETQQLDRLFAGVGGEFDGPPMRPGALRIIEGLNEIDNLSPSPGLAAATTWQRQLFCLTRQADFCPAGSVDPHVAGALVASFTSNGPVAATATPGAGFPADLANDHPYVMPSNNYQRSVLDTITDADASVYGFNPLQGSTIAGISTESGAYVEPTDVSRNDLGYLNGFDDGTRAIKVLDSLLDHVLLGQISYVYQLFDNYETPDNPVVDSDNRYGLFIATGTTDAQGQPGYIPTAAATAIHNLLGFTALPGVMASPGGNNCLPYTLAGLPDGAQSLLVQVNDSGTYAIVLWWDNPLDWNKDAHVPVPVSARPVTIDLADDAFGWVFDAIGGGGPIAGFGGTSEISLALGDDPLVVVVNTSNPGRACP